MTDYPVNSTARVYYDIDGNPKTLHQMVRDEPEWAESRIKAGEEAIEELQAAKDYASDQAIHLELVAKALGVPAEPHQGRAERIIEAVESLAAHVEMIEAHAKHCGWDNPETSILAMILDRGPTTSLARRDALKEGEALDKFVGNNTLTLDQYQYVVSEKKRLSRQAEEAPNAE